jgi:hypothetical protein
MESEAVQRPAGLKYLPEGIVLLPGLYHICAGETTGCYKAF